MSTNEPNTELRRHFIRDIIEADIATGTFGGKVVTRFPPEPNGFLHIGHAKAFCLSYGLAEDYHGVYNLRFDDTNPVKEDPRFVEAIKKDIKWLGFDWEDREYYASDYFEQMYGYAVELIKKDKAFVDSQTLDEIRKNRGTIKSPGTNSPYRTRSIQENLDLFARMRAGEFEDGALVLRAKIDMASPNMLMRDPIMYRIRHARHHRTGDSWCIYPMYDYAHCLEDSIEGITHSLCSLEFEAHRPLYDWYLEQLNIHHSKQIEFARLNITHTVLSKRKVETLVSAGVVEGWDDPRLLTLSGLRRRGYTPQSIRNFIDRIGVAKSLSTVDFALLEHTVREDLNKRSNRVMAVLNPVKVIIDNYPADQTEEMQAINNPENPEAGTRLVPFSRELFIERDDFMEEPPKKFYRLAPGREVRLRYAYFITCTHVVKDASGTITEIHCTYDPATKGGNAPDGRKVKATMHWVSAAHAYDAEVRLYDKLLTVESTDEVAEGKTFMDYINPNSLEIRSHCKLEPSLAKAAAGDRFQFERLGYFSVDPVYSTPGRPVFNRTATLRDEWAKLRKK
ncbi:MAG: glutamine--tRNA ligase/YqeY domain fusion protein [Candidatus Cloacimonetes bacterium]|nr:glutamine--tRNA ligase/YqeY domain fusion protein [Candidatus Cloacimonadota bacterium]